MESNMEIEHGVVIKPNVNFQDVKDLVFNLYGFKVSKIVELNGYDDQNFHIIVESNKVSNLDSDSEGDFVLKITNSLDSKNSQLFDAQTSILLHLRENGILCPKPIPTKHCLYTTKVKLAGDEHVVRLLEYIKGVILYNVPCTPDLLRQTGEFVARLDKALMTFRHAAYDTHTHVWMLESVSKLRNFIHAVPDENRRNLVLTIIKEFENRVLSISDTLEKGMIHGDFNEQNIIVENEGEDWKIKAIIDFGDCQVACYLYEIAITMTYMIVQAKDIDAGGYVLAGYSSIRIMPEKEYNLLKVCIASRLCQSLVMGAYKSLQDPRNQYVLVTSTHGWTLLEKIWEEPEEKLLKRWKLISKKL